mmetsp:Transcript_28170/g.53184  ORF Transcript_28170/g.53184 Transcript_28170/m.53184 type:complete len:134 (+) Transcript_28170:4181-4582(+)
MMMRLLSELSCIEIKVKSPFSSPNPLSFTSSSNSSPPVTSCTKLEKKKNTKLLRSLLMDEKEVGTSMTHLQHKAFDGKFKTRFRMFRSTHSGKSTFSEHLTKFIVSHSLPEECIRLCLLQIHPIDLLILCPRR